MRRFLNILFWAVIIGYFFLAMGFVSDRRRSQVCTGVNIVVSDSTRSRFVTSTDISQIADSRSQKLAGNLFDSINSGKVEQRLNEYAPVHRAQVYKTIDGTVHAAVEQRAPVLRVINRYGESFYIDKHGEMLKHSNRYCARVLVANGFINMRIPAKGGLNVLDENNASPDKRNIPRELFDLANYINNSKFWKAQVQQIYVNEDGDFELIPLVGSHVIIFGAFDRVDDKFSKLESLYRNGLNVKGWNTYDEINLKYNGQIICTKRKTNT